MPAEPASITPDVAGLLLAGGRSSRMGSNKALLALPEGSACTFVERLASLLSEICAETFLVTRDEINAREYVFASPDAKVRLIYDHIPDQGPLMALYSGLQATSCSHTLVLAVDQPFVRPELLACLRAFPLGAEALVPRVQGIPQLLLARYPRSLLPIIAECLQNGQRSVRDLLSHVPVRFLEEEELRAVDADLRSFMNINTPADFRQARSFALHLCGEA